MFRFIPSSVLSGLKCLQDHGIIHQDVKYVVPRIFHLPGLRRDPWIWRVACEQTGENPFPAYQGPIIRYRFRRLRHVRRFNFLAGSMSYACCTPSNAKHRDSSWQPLTSVESSLGYVAPEAPNQKEYGMVVYLWSIGWGYLPSLPTIHSTMEY